MDFRDEMEVSGTGHFPTEFWSSLESSVGFLLVSVQFEDVRMGEVHYRKGGVLSNIRQAIGHVRDVNGLGTVPIKKTIFHGQSLLQMMRGHPLLLTGYVATHSDSGL